MANWNCEDERVACQFYLKHKEKSKEKADELMTLLNNKFTIGSVRAKIKNYEFLDTGKGLANYSFLSEFTYKQLLKKGSKKGLSKAARGIQLGDVANAAVRNVLTILSIHIGDISALMSWMHQFTLIINVLIQAEICRPKSRLKKMAKKHQILF